MSQAVRCKTHIFIKNNSESPKVYYILKIKKLACFKLTLNPKKMNCVLKKFPDITFTTSAVEISLRDPA